MTREDVFWCVWNEGGNSPTVKHRDFRTAKAEAQRLARHAPGERFVVLASALAFQTPALAVTQFMDDRTIDNLDEIPF